MAVEDFLSRMNTLVDDLRAHPKVTLLNYHIPPPATEAYFAAVEAHIGRSLPDDIRAFYNQCNGCQLRWVHKDNKEVDQKLWSGFIQGPFDHEEIQIERGLEGVVNILGIQEVFFRQLPFRKKEIKDRELGRVYTINGESLEFRSLASSIWSFDLFTATRDFSIIHLDGKPEVTHLLLTSDNLFPSLGGSIITLNDYLNLIILKKGVADARIFHFLPKDIDYNSRAINSTDGLINMSDPAPYDLAFAYHR